MNSIGNTYFLLRKLIPPTAGALPIHTRKLQFTPLIDAQNINPKTEAALAERKKLPASADKSTNTQLVYYRDIGIRNTGIMLPGFIRQSLHNRLPGVNFQTPVMTPPLNLTQIINNTNKQKRIHKKISTEMNSDSSKATKTKSAEIRAPSIHDILKHSSSHKISARNRGQDLYINPSNPESKNTSISQETVNPLKVTHKNRAQDLRDTTQNQLQKSALQNNIMEILKVVKGSLSDRQNHDAYSPTRQETEINHHTIATPTLSKMDHNLQLKLLSDTRNTSKNKKTSWEISIILKDNSNKYIRSTITLSGNKISTIFNSEQQSTANIIRSQINILRNRFLDVGFNIGQLTSYSEVPHIEIEEQFTYKSRLDEII